MKRNRFRITLLASIAVVAMLSGAGQVASAAIIPTPVPPAPASGEADHLVAWYELTDVDPATDNEPDSSGHGHAATFQTGSLEPLVSSPSTGTCFDGFQDVALPDNLVSGLSSISVSFQTQYPNKFSSSAYAFFTFGGHNPDGYLAVGGNLELSATSWMATPGPQEASSRFVPPPTGWTLVTYTYDAPSHTATLYEGGQQIAQNTNVTIQPNQFGPSDGNNTIGDNTVATTDSFTGCLKDFRIYNNAIPSTLVGNLASADVDANALTVDGLDDVRGDIYLPTTLPDGATVSWSSSNPSIIDSNGIVSRPVTTTKVSLEAKVNIGGELAVQQFTANVIAAPPAPGAMTGYAFAYFTGNTSAQQNIFIAVSNGNDVLHYTPVNNDKPVLVSHFGSGGLRDPSIIRSPEGDTFYLIATDLDISQFPNWDASARTGSQHIEVWKSHNLVDWTQQAHTLVSLPTAGNTWAPDAIWDPTINQYVVYWASSNYSATDKGHTGTTYNEMMYSTTRDFVNFTTPQVWQNPGGDRIDAAVTSDNGTFYRFTKAVPTTLVPQNCGQDILEESSPNLLTLTTPQSQGWTTVDTCIGTGAGAGAVEGPIIVKSNPEDKNNVDGRQAYYLFVDDSEGVGYEPLESPSISNPTWVKVTNFTLPVMTNGVWTRHGGILPITDAEMAQLKTGPTAGSVPNYGKVLQYNFAETGGTTVRDITGHGLNGTTIGGATLGGGSISFNGTDGYVLLPNNLMAKQSNLTIDTDVLIKRAQLSPYMIYGLGYTDVNTGAGSGYLMATGDPTARAALTPSDWTKEQSASSTSALPRGQWVRLTYVVSHDWSSNTTVTYLYVNGVLAGSSLPNQTNGISPGEIDLGYTPDDYIGRSLFNSDHYFEGKMKSFTIWNYALSQAQVAALGAP